ncbi:MULTISPECIES: hypothetical protein [Cryobacterium]|uniref:Uncharacterized protein n=1 Tax=Cryobacterium zongtaii TaxID=1259217 RepID=A0A2S3ZKE4_9MICO|nr:MULTISPECIES: hypothetical protein [Cryobacterium]ASD21618.1 hypothetical protein B7495_05500 [Cryobacterium sp. LW097]POH63108.1 hypothetical protein C3B60_17340 [Cryobacterium zongtaii]POH68827.1 hypothetical protein C3B61_02655 [Cryobacterium zongtaii]TFC43770.1 hypothetical protein E3O57_13175 [Cryobacterium sp. TMN-39-2]TFC54963.1 hypothetical protein E3O68_08265 [Cryobacterium sp. TMB3-1-2]
MTAPTPEHSPTSLTAAEAAAVRDAVAEAVLGSPTGLRADLESDPDAYLRLVGASRTAAEETSRLLRDSINGARAAGHSWDALGRVLGVSRQAAQQRFSSASQTGSAGPAAAAHDGEPGHPRRKVLSPVTAFDEMAILAIEGRRGWHVVDYGTLYHVLEASDRQWEHRRLLWTPGNAARRHLEAEGWRLVGETTFPWGYYTRALDSAAEPA